MERRFPEDGGTCSPVFLRQILQGVLSPGVYKGFDLSISGSTLILGALHSETAPGAFVTTEGMIITQTSTVSLTLSLSPNTNYTIIGTHVAGENLVGGTTASYSLVSTFLTTAPANSVIIGWIIYSSGDVTDDMLITSTPLNAAQLAQETKAALDMLFPKLIVFNAVDVETGITFNEGWDSTYHLTYHSVENLVSAPNLTAIGRIQWIIRAVPYALDLNFYLPGSGSLVVKLYDTTYTLQKTETFVSPINQWQTASIFPPRNFGTWAFETEDSVATLELTYSVPQNCAIKISKIRIDYWPYGLIFHI